MFDMLVGGGICVASRSITSYFRRKTCTPRAMCLLLRSLHVHILLLKPSDDVAFDFIPNYSSTIACSLSRLYFSNCAAL